MVQSFYRKYIGPITLIGSALICSTVYYIVHDPKQLVPSINSLGNVLGALWAAWIASKALKRQEDKDSPKLCMIADMDSRSHICLLVLENEGGGPAFNITIQWDQLMINHNKEKVSFYGNGENIPILKNGKSIEIPLDIGISLNNRFERGETSYSGTIFYEDNSGKKYEEKFIVSRAIQTKFGSQGRSCSSYK